MKATRYKLPPPAIIPLTVSQKVISGRKKHEEAKTIIPGMEITSGII
jgi:hypothetical protein